MTKSYHNDSKIQAYLRIFVKQILKQRLILEILRVRLPMFRKSIVAIIFWGAILEDSDDRAS